MVHLSETTAFPKQACKVSPRTACQAAARALLFKVTFATDTGYRNQRVILQSCGRCSRGVPSYIFSGLQRCHIQHVSDIYF